MTIPLLAVQPLTRAAFEPFGDVIETDGAEVRLINNGTTQRFHDLAKVDVTGAQARVLVNIFRGQAFAAPIDIAMLERHPLGSQAFYPLQERPFLVVVAQDDAGRPGQPVAFRAQGNQGVNYGRNVWHHPLIALDAVSDFLVVDRGGAGDNLEEFFFKDMVYRIETI
ncbi:ureidoglycolate lyase [Phyllobacterium myrsinacearum]|uniref:Ureidoglycolate lyase n=1 Tax=Phyllobacterium myrsinacearum TaxID=28101 RepID=A0A2S9JBI0_9HYPH|nr:ureidoglycolate lyase [Phyllobacterium myrsinacearum]PRD50162.1 ureidoglycolate lyase [Phyllobacterium myrsinacearum]PWV90783.1 ureidoglycolate lyase [Phyllobacterium myrsinacearum]RZU97185.1 ureidoglycolate lyase [Phyllobacterium myrsinacearum]